MADSHRDATGWFAEAVNLREAGHYVEASEALAEAEALEFSGVRIAFERARLAALTDKPGEAVAQLQGIADAGFTALGFIVNDPILGELRGNEAFDRLVAAMAAKAYPCEHDEAFRAFDFWVGNWDVHGPAGAFAGTNTIERAERGCVLIENWTSASGGTGMSINYLDKTKGEWVQVWNAEGGSQIHIRGGITDDGMLLVGTLHDVANDKTTPFRGLWTPLPDGRVRQFFEQSADGGKTWTAWFEGFYTRKN
ncbi:MAG: hypothetical protein KJP17_10125 [Gammaproteobacteria bacterium]|nr:hypothetical protein [Gammaproteobacteria bacterium]